MNRIDRIINHIENNALTDYDEIFVMSEGTLMDVTEHLLSSKAFYICKNTMICKEGDWIWTSDSSIENGEFEDYMEYDLTNESDLDIVEREIGVV